MIPWTVYSPGQNTGVGSLSLFQGIFPTQGLNPGVQHCRRILYQLSLVKGSPGYVYLPFLHFITIYILFSMVLSLKNTPNTCRGFVLFCFFFFCIGSSLQQIRFSLVEVLGLSRPEVCGSEFPYQESNLFPLHWKLDS